MVHMELDISGLAKFNSEHKTLNAAKKAVANFRDKNPGTEFKYKITSDVDGRLLLIGSQFTS